MAGEALLARVFVLCHRCTPDLIFGSAYTGQRCMKKKGHPVGSEQANWSERVGRGDRCHFRSMNRWYAVSARVLLKGLGWERKCVPKYSRAQSDKRLRRDDHGKAKNSVGH
eukprot:Anaeramoba_flamelloidesa1055248_32.p3 GENE.a1055248_32~~a1055248_32.p3  ORF type:complete len:111 (+),score=6.04 a1055248_32:45-377(+)